MKSCRDDKMSLCYAEGSLYEQFRRSAYKHRFFTATDYFGARMRYDKMLEKADQVSNVLLTLGVGKGDRVCICLPNMPTVAALFYGISRLGAVSVMVHPLSSTEEVCQFIKESQAKAVVMMDVAFVRHQKRLGEMGMHNVLCVSMWEDAPFFKRPFIRRAVLKKAGLKRVPKVSYRLKDLLKHHNYACPQPPTPIDDKRDIAVILFSGGSSGEPKGIALSAYNFAALGGQVYSQVKDWPKEPKMMAILPFFHGFGLGVCMHTALIYGMTSIMVAQFNAKEFASILKRQKPNIITGVPTLYQALLQEKSVGKMDLSFLKGAFVGGDACPIALKKKMDVFLKQHGAPVTLKEGYGLTETVTACVLTPEKEKEGSIGLPLPDVRVRVVDPVSHTVLPPDTEGEIAIISPTVMLGYLDAAETERVFFTDESGEKWLLTGDIGRMDDEGYLYFSGRSKRIVKVSGFPVYPAKIEQFLETLPNVARACCVASPDPYKMNVIKAIIEPITPPQNLRHAAAEILAASKAHESVYARVRVVEFMEKLPVTKVGKVDWKSLQVRENAKQ